MDKHEKVFFGSICLLIIVAGLFIHKTFSDYDSYQKALEYQCVDKKLYKKLPSDTYWTPTTSGCLPVEKEKNNAV